MNQLPSFPLFFFFFFFFASPILGVLAGAFPAVNNEVLGLIVFKKDLRDPLNRLSSWTEDSTDPCHWKGVACNGSGSAVVTSISLDDCSLSGTLSSGLLSLTSLRTLSLSNNRFSGPINPAFFELPLLQFLDLSLNHLSGGIPPSFSSSPLLAYLNLSFNGISGALYPGPRTIHTLDLSHNLLSGEIPAGMGDLTELSWLDLSRNNLSGQIPGEIVNCEQLKSFLVRGNSIKGWVPEWVGQIEMLDLSENAFSGGIPASLGNIGSLRELYLSWNELGGEIPGSLANCSGLLVLDIRGNRFTGLVPGWILEGNMGKGLQILDMSSNGFTGAIPGTVGAMTMLKKLNISRNFLTGSIPAEIWGLGGIVSLDLSNNMLQGKVPYEIGRAISLVELNIANNALVGTIPTEISKCSSLLILNMSRNQIWGEIPASISNISGLEKVDLSYNRLWGILPEDLSFLSHLQLFNVSHNRLNGPLPNSNFFTTIPPSSLSPNQSFSPKPIVLNPDHTSSAPAYNPLSPGHCRRLVLSISALIAIAAAALIAVGVIAITMLNIRFRSSLARRPSPNTAALAFSGEDDISCSIETDPEYGKLVLFSGEADLLSGDGTHALLNKDCELGRGGFGSVYHSVLTTGRPVAIRKLNVSSMVKSQEEFEHEVRRLGKIGHPNLVTVEGFYWTPSLQLLISEYVEGSLYRHLHEEEMSSLSWTRRIETVLGAARGIAHLHGAGVIHYNVKSANVMVSESGEVKVGDFGLAGLLPALDHYVLSSKVQSALGYAAPEVVCKGARVTEKCDVYGFGVVVLEVVTGRRAVEYTEDDVEILVEMVRGAVEGGVGEEWVDPRMGSDFSREEAVRLMRLGLMCVAQVPSARPEMREVVSILEMIHSGDNSDRVEEVDMV